MHRSQPIGNKLCAARVHERNQELHRQKLKGIKPSIDTKVPNVMQLDHVKNNLKREQILEERYTEIDRSNRILLQKMSDIMRQPSLSKEMKAPAARPLSLNKDNRKKELMRITKENQGLLKRIQLAQPMYDHVRWEQDHRQARNYLKNCCEYPLTLSDKIAAGNEMSSTDIDELLPTKVVANNNTNASEASAPTFTSQKKPAAATSTASAKNEQDDVKYVLKEGKRIGTAYYLVEMATDGRTLTVSAYDGDSQQTLELVINEKNHRKLYREYNGDYGLIAKRLQIEGDRLTLLPAEPVNTFNADELNNRLPAGESSVLPDDSSSVLGSVANTTGRGANGFTQRTSNSENATTDYSAIMGSNTQREI